MALNLGKSLGPYRIGDLLGSGGMGEVYRARDTRLERDVAIKVLRADQVVDPGQQRRFALEARAASGLNHPNILTVHDVGMENGIPYIVSELVDGESLGAIVAKGPLPLKKVLDIAVQVAAGLAAAHQAGIVHRDLKPANIMLTRAGLVKILDFGLAKNIARKDSLAGMPQGPTQPGFIIGTATYMSPEQVRGGDLDHRTDQFSLGLVIYETIAGKPAFARSSAVSTMAAIVEEPAKPVTDFNPAVPAPLRWCLDRCLAKDREDRYHSTGDLQRELETIRAHLDELSSSGAQPALPAAPVRHARRWWPKLLALGALATGCLAWEAFMVPKTMVDMRYYQIQPLISTGAHEGDPAWSADGRSMAYTGEVNGIRQVFARDLSSPMPAQITNSPVDCRAPFWSPDDTRIYYLSSAAGVSGVWMVGSAGGSPELVQAGASAAALSPDGKTLAFLRSDPTASQPLELYFTARGGSGPRASRASPFASGKYQSGYLRFSPGGKTLGAWLARWDGASDFWVLPYPGGEGRVAFSMALGAYPFSWMPDSRRVVFGAVLPGSVGADLFMAGVAHGAMRQISAITRDTNQPAVSPDGKTVAFQAAEDDYEIVSVPLDGSPVQNLISTRRNEFDPMWAPGGDQLVFVTDRTGVLQIWLKSVRDGWERPLVTEKDFGRSWIADFREPQFSPDGRRIAYTVAAGNGHSIYVSAVAGGKPLRLSPDSTDERSATWSGDGAWIAFLQNVNGRWTLVKARSGGGDQPAALHDGLSPTHPKWNHHDKWIACTTAEGLTLVSDDGKLSDLVSPGDWLVYGWSLDGKTLYGIKRLPGGRRVVASLDPEKRVEIAIGDLQLPAAAEVHGFSMAADGKTFATSFSRPGGDIWVLRGFEKPGVMERLP